ncbi:hypothetical protein DK419_04140 [Methylobacterium terrae]|uniref:Uncharacterized protein n=1 Tax=Methylobacterium terrae TaxID=2202827 RepID=A0A2U8WK95_9HYPH|nr:hypothetical protein DK419_04140 [Methylobacterium terrae]
MSKVGRRSSTVWRDELQSALVQLRPLHDHPADLGQTRLRDVAADIWDDVSGMLVERAKGVAPGAKAALPEAERARLARDDRPVAATHHS